MKHKKHQKRYSNPESVMREAGKVLVATAVGGAAVVAANIGAAKISTDPRVQSASLAGAGLVAGVALHYGDFAPRVGKAVAAGSVAVAGVQMAQHYQLESRVRSLVSSGTGTAPGGYPVPGVRQLGSPAPAGYPAPGVRQAGYPLAGSRMR